MDFYHITAKEDAKKKGIYHLFPDFTVGRTTDLMVRAQSFYAIWDEERQIWSTDEYDVQRLVDADLDRYAKQAEAEGKFFDVMHMRNFGSNIWVQFRKFMRHISDNSHPLDENLTFANTEVKKNDYVSKRLPYALEPGTTDAWDELMDVLYSPGERAKIEWAIGAVVAGDAKRIQKFLVLYGPAGTGKSTVLDIIGKLFDGYVTYFDARALGSNNGTFATEAFRHNPLVAIQHDGDLSRIEDNTRLNQIIAHEYMMMNEKFKPSYPARVNAFLFMGTNQPVKISDAKSGIIRRLIDVKPTGNTIETNRYHTLMQQITFELGAVATKCLERYDAMGKNYYSGYRPVEMMLQTDVYYNFVEAYADIFRSQDGVSLKQAYDLYKEYCGYAGIDKIMAQYRFREELRNYFEEFHDRYEVEGRMVRSYYLRFKDIDGAPIPVDNKYEIKLDGKISAYDLAYPDIPAQYAGSHGNPVKVWAEVDTTLKDLDTRELHWSQPPEGHIVLDFDLVDEDGEKDLERNLAEAAKFPPTYTELSQSGLAVHLHYVYAGDVTELDNVFDVGIEVKTLLGNQSLRRRAVTYNSLPISVISSGLPKKAPKPMTADVQQIKSEVGLRRLVEKNLRKEIHPGTKPSVDFIAHILQEAYDSGLSYDLGDMRPVVMAFAARSSNHSRECLRTYQNMQFVGKEEMAETQEYSTDPLVFFDVEVYPNLFVVCWKYAGPEATVVKMVNPEPSEIEPMLTMKLVGFNNRRYDNHMLYARYLGYTLEELYALSQKIIDKKERSMFGEAYNISYADIYDFSSKKQGLKRFQIELGIHHMELDIPWDKPVPEGMWDKVVDYCTNDVISTEVVFESREADFVARSILADLSGLSVNHPTKDHAGRIIFGDNKRPQSEFNYVDLSKRFPGYKFEIKVGGMESTYRGEVVGEGGYVFAEPGAYENVTVLDVVSMHPASIEALELFGPYTSKFSELKAARVAIKRKDYDAAAEMFGGRLRKHLTDATEEWDIKNAEALAYALKIVINSVYGLTSARFPNVFKDNRNTDNIVAKRGALFMIDLKYEVMKRGFQVVHIKTDSIKIPNCPPDLIRFITDFGRGYGYDFELEATYEKFCLVNDAVYIARSGDLWTAVGAQFAHPYVYKTLFSQEPIEFDDLCETKTVQKGVMYLDFTGTGELDQMVHVGRAGSFVPVEENGADLYRVADGKKYAVTGTKGYKWIEREIAAQREMISELRVDMTYFEELRKEAFEAIDDYEPFERFVER